MDFSKLPAILTPDLGLLFWMLLAFAVVFFVLAKYGFPAITGMVEERKKYIDESLKKAHEASERLENIKQEGEAILQEARDRQAQILKEAAETRDAIVEQAQQKAREEGARLLGDAKTAIEQEWSRLSRRHVRKALVFLVTLRPPSNRRSGLPSPTSVSKLLPSVWRLPRRCSVRI